MVGIQGETVRLTFIGSTDTTHSSSIAIYNAQNALRPLEAYERLIVDRLEANLSTSCDVLTVAQGASTRTQSTLLASLSPVMPVFRSLKEGIACPLGVTPSVLNGDTTQVALTGSGRIITEANTSRKPWMAALTA